MDLTRFSDLVQTHGLLRLRTELTSHDVTGLRLWLMELEDIADLYKVLDVMISVEEMHATDREKQEFVRCLVHLLTYFGDQASAALERAQGLLRPDLFKVVLAKSFDLSCLLMPLCIPRIYGYFSLGYRYRITRFTLKHEDRILDPYIGNGSILMGIVHSLGLVPQTWRCELVDCGLSMIEYATEYVNWAPSRIPASFYTWFKQAHNEILGNIQLPASVFGFLLCNNGAIAAEAMRRGISQAFVQQYSKLENSENVLVYPIMDAALCAVIRSLSIEYVDKSFLLSLMEIDLNNFSFFPRSRSAILVNSHLMKLRDEEKSKKRFTFRNMQIRIGSQCTRRPTHHGHTNEFDVIKDALKAFARGLALGNNQASVQFLKCVQRSGRKFFAASAYAIPLSDDAIKSLCMCKLEDGTTLMHILADAKATMLWYSKAQPYIQDFNARDILGQTPLMLYSLSICPPTPIVDCGIALIFNPNVEVNAQTLRGHGVFDLADFSLETDCCDPLLLHLYKNLARRGLFSSKSAQISLHRLGSQRAPLLSAWAMWHSPISLLDSRKRYREYSKSSLLGTILDQLSLMILMVCAAKNGNRSSALSLLPWDLHRALLMEYLFTSAT